jgi:hypothetical protein
VPGHLPDRATTLGNDFVVLWGHEYHEDIAALEQPLAGRPGEQDAILRLLRQANLRIAHSEQQLLDQREVDAGGLATTDQDVPCLRNSDAAVLANERHNLVQQRREVKTSGLRGSFHFLSIRFSMAIVWTVCAQSASSGWLSAVSSVSLI